MPNTTLNYNLLALLSRLLTMFAQEFIILVDFLKLFL